MNNETRVLDTKIFETHNYDLFKRLKGNRDACCVKKILGSIHDVGYIMNPIMINENFEIVDGQNRYEALKELDLPIQYYVVNDADINIARALNLGRSNWKPIDYVKSYAEDGYKSYQLLLKLLDEHKNYNIQTIWAISQNKAMIGGWQTKDINNGTFQLDDDGYEKTKQKIDLLDSINITEIQKRMQGSRIAFISGVNWCLSVDKCDKSRLLNKVSFNYPLIRPIATTITLLEDISAIYNKGLKKEDKILFDLIFRKETA